MLTTNRITAVFDSQSQAEAAIHDLRAMGVSDANLSIISRHGDNANATGSGTAAAAAADNAEDAASGAGKGLLAGAGVGALFGLAAAMIPGVGPFITAGALATSLGAAGGGAVAGAVVGGTSGAIAGALSNAGYNEHEASYYGSEVERGGVFVAVDLNGALSAEQVRDTLVRNGGRFANTTM
jgi:hypothetical protein